MAPTESTPTETMHFPGGESQPAYRWAFNAFVILFLITLCIGLLNFLGSYLKNMMK